VINLALLGLALVVLGFILIFVAMLLMLLPFRSAKGKAEGFGIVLVGPIPIFFGYGSKKWLAAAAAIAAVLAAIMLYAYLTR